MDINKELDKIFTFVKPNCRLGYFDIVNDHLQNIDLNINEDLLIGYLCATLDWKDKLKYRSILFKNIKFTLDSVYNYKQVNHMLIGLE